MSETRAAAPAPAPSQAGNADAHRVCPNCGTTLIGPHCHGCGQSAHLHHSLGDLLEEVIHGVTHFEGKAWRTLPMLLLYPGVLTRRYLDGARARYLSPLALFLFASFLMFIAISMTSGPQQEGVQVLAEVDVGEQRERLYGELQAVQQQLDAAQLQLDALTDAAQIDAAQRALEQQRREQRRLEVLIAAIDARHRPTADNTATEVAGVIEFLRTVLPGLHIDTGSAERDARIRHKLESPDFLIYKLTNTAYKYAFVLIPISLPFLALMFAGRRDVSLYDLSVFSLYSLSFMAMLAVLGVFLVLLPINLPLLPLGLVIPPLHMYVQLRHAFGLSLIGALWRTLALILSAGTAFALFLLLTVLLALG